MTDYSSVATKISKFMQVWALLDLTRSEKTETRNNWNVIFSPNFSFLGIIMRNQKGICILREIFTDDS
jgi:hypothetical protein